MNDPTRTSKALSWRIAAAAVLATAAVLVPGLLESRVEPATAGRVDPHEGSTSAGYDWSEVADGEVALYGSPAGARRATTPSSGDPGDRFTWPAPGPDSLPVETVIGTQAVATVGAGETAVVDFVVPRRAIVRGRVVARGQPVAGAIVQHKTIHPKSLCYLATNFGGGPEGETVTTGPDGRFEQSLPYGGDIALWAVAPDGGRSAEARLTLSSGTRFEVELAFPTARR